MEIAIYSEGNIPGGRHEARELFLNNKIINVGKKKRKGKLFTTLALCMSRFQQHGASSRHIKGPAGNWYKAAVSWRLGRAGVRDLGARGGPTGARHVFKAARATTTAAERLTI